MVNTPTLSMLLEQCPPLKEYPNEEVQLVWDNLHELCPSVLRRSPLFASTLLLQILMRSRSPEDARVVLRPDLVFDLLQMERCAQDLEFDREEAEREGEKHTFEIAILNLKLQLLQAKASEKFATKS